MEIKIRTVKKCHIRRNGKVVFFESGEELLLDSKEAIYLLNEKCAIILVGENDL